MPKKRISNSQRANSPRKKNRKTPKGPIKVQRGWADSTSFLKDSEIPGIAEMKSWQIEEACFYACGKVPVRWEELFDLADPEKKIFVKADHPDVYRLHEKALKAVKSGELPAEWDRFRTHHVIPRAFIKWARAKGHQVPIVFLKLLEIEEEFASEIDRRHGSGMTLSQNAQMIDKNAAKQHRQKGAAKTRQIKTEKNKKRNKELVERWLKKMEGKPPSYSRTKGCKEVAKEYWPADEIEKHPGKWEIVRLAVIAPRKWIHPAKQDMCK